MIHFISGDFNFFKPCSTDVDGKQSPKIIQVFDASYMPDAKGTRQYQSDVEISEVSVSVIDVSWSNLLTAVNASSTEALPAVAME